MSLTSSSETTIVAVVEVDEHKDVEALSTGLRRADVSDTSRQEHEAREPESEREDEPKTQKKSIRFKLTILCLCTVAIAGSMDAVIVAACLSAIAADLGGSSVESFWIGTAFLLAQCAMNLPYLTISNLFGRKWPMIAAIAIFLFGSLLCATAQSMPWLIAARVVQGMGAGGTLNLVSVIISDITTMRERGLYLSFVSLSWAIGTIVGVPLGGLIAQEASWRIVFWINIPILVPTFGLIWTLNLKTDTSSFMSRIARIDYVGLVLFISGTCLFLIGLTTGNTVAPWSATQVLLPLILGIVSWITFILYEWKGAKEPMLPLRVFYDRSAAVGYFCTFVHGLVLWSYTYYMIIFFLGGMQHGQFQSALETLPGTAFTAPSAFIAGLLVKKYLRFRSLIWIGWALLVLGQGLNVLQRPDSSGWILYGVRVISSTGGGILFPTTQFPAQVNQRPSDVGTAASLIVFCRSLGQAFGVAIGSVVLQNQWTIEVANRVADGTIPAMYAISSSQAESAYHTIAGFPEAIQLEYQWVYSNSLRMVWTIGVCIAASGLVASLLLRNESLDKGLQSLQTFEEPKVKKEKASAV